MKIRISGKKLELLHVLSHPIGYSSFLKYLQLEYASEGLLFWCAGRTFEDKCRQQLTLLSVLKTAAEAHGQYNLRDGGCDSDNNTHSSENEVGDEDGFREGDVDMQCVTVPSLDCGNHPQHGSDAAKQSPTDRLLAKSGSTDKSKDKRDEATIAKVQNMNTMLSDMEKRVTVIVDSFIKPQSDHQINISSTLQNEVVRQADDLRSQCKVLIHRQSTTYVLNYADLEILLQRFSGLFSKAIYEIYNLLKKDNFVRYKKTKEFSDFIKRLKPINNSNSRATMKL